MLLEEIDLRIAEAPRRREECAVSSSAETAQQASFRPTLERRMHGHAPFRLKLAPEATTGEQQRHETEPTAASVAAEMRLLKRSHTVV